MDSALVLPMFAHVVMAVCLYAFLTVVRAPAVWGVAAASDGANPWAGSSAYRRHSMAAPWIRMSSWAQGSGAPSATAIWAATRSIPVTISVTGCSTWSRAFTSMK